MVNSRLKEGLGQVPGTPVYTGSKSTIETVIEVFDYSEQKVSEVTINDLSELSVYFESSNVSWVNVNGLGDTKTIETIGHMSKLHPLIIEDIVYTQQRPKLEEYDKYLFVVLKMLYFDKKGILKAEHLSLILHNNSVISFQESEGDVFESIRDRIRYAKGRIRAMGTDYLFYVLMDAVVDNYLLMLDTLGEKITQFEDDLFANTQENNFIEEIQSLKKEILKIRKAVLPVRELVNKLEKGEHPAISKKTKYYLRDLYDHAIQASESVEIYREMIWGLMDMYMTTISNKMNEVMKVLTIISTIFIPLTFLVGIYGMNFSHMPELSYRHGYKVFWGVIIVISLLLILFFRRKKWL